MTFEKLVQRILTTWNVTEKEANAIAAAALGTLLFFYGRADVPNTWVRVTLPVSGSPYKNTYLTWIRAILSIAC